MHTLKLALAQTAPYLLALRRGFHQNPEVSLQEFRTAKRIEEELDCFGIDHSRVGDTGVLGVLRSQRAAGPVLVLRADMDALPIQETSGVPYCSAVPGVMHACGHDAHTACLLGAAKILSARRSDLGGEIRFLFQPAEEIGQGARRFLEAGALKGADRVFGLHTAPDLPVGTVGLKPGLNNASVDHFTIRVKGKAAHVSTPQLGVDALYIASQIVVSVQALVTRMTSPVEPVIIGVGKLQSGTTYNAVAESAVLEGTTRTISHQSRENIKALVSRTAQHMAALYGGTAEIEWEDFASPLINDPEVCRELSAVVESLLGADKVATDRTLSLSGDDFAEFLLHTPGAYAYLGTGNAAKPNTLVSHHNGNFDLDEDALAVGAGRYAGYALAMQHLG